PTAELARDADGGGAIGARRDADPQTLEARDRTAVGGRGLVGDGEDLVVDAGVQDVGDEARADSLNVVVARLAAREHRRRSGLDGGDADVGAPWAQDLDRARDTTPRG